MLFRLVFVCLIFVLANADVYNDIRSDEEKRHKATLTQYVKAALSGGLSSLFPGVTEAEKAEADRLLGDVLPIGDPSRPLPDNEEKIERLLCKNHAEKGAKILAFVRKRWPTQLIPQISVRHLIHSIGRKNDEYCRDAVTRAVYTRNASIINQYTNQLNVARNKFIDAMMAVVHGNATKKLAIVCCAFFNFKVQLVNTIPVPETKRFVRDYVECYNGPAIKYLCLYHSEGSKACAELVIPAPPTHNVPRFTSTYSAGVEAVSKLTAISA